MTRGLAIIGNGKMGRLVAALAPEYGFETRLALDSRNNANGAALHAEYFRGIDVATDFSTPAAAPLNIRQLAAIGVPVVCGTTGWSAELPALRGALESNGLTSVVWGPNFSVGMHQFRQIVAAAARAFAAEPEYQAWGWEIHHALKKDAPSGTLLAIAEDMKRSGYDRPVSLSANRAGAHPGTHEMGFDSAGDTITIRHTSRSREGFARGALRAARWLIGKKGFFEFKDIVHELG